MQRAAAASNTSIDEHVDAEIAACLSLEAPRSFFLFAGAGSGKTYSLIEALKLIRRDHASKLSIRGQRVAVVTYTNAACDEIKRRIEFDPIFNVSTIHSFAWGLIKGFNGDIRNWLRVELEKDITEIREAEAKGRAGTKASITRLAQIESKTSRLSRLNEIKTFTYSPTGTNNQRDSLNHTEVVQIASSFLSGKRVMQRILVNLHPFLLIGESQDTNKELVDALLLVEAAHKGQFCLGFIGDTMQRIYNDGKEKIENFLPPDWARPIKKLNRRCPTRVVKLINKIRERGDGQTQEAALDNPDGFVRLFLFPTGLEDKPQLEDEVRNRMSEITGDVAWRKRHECKILILEHQMAARRMGFDTIFRALYPVESFRTGLLDGSLPSLKPFLECVLPLTAAANGGDKFQMARVTRERSPLLERSKLKAASDQRLTLKYVSESASRLAELCAKEGATFGQVLEEISDSGIFEIPDVLNPVLKLRRTEAIAGEAKTDAVDPLSDEAQGLLSLLRCPFSELAPYSLYITDKAPFGTHQGVKGLEFERVMVIVDDTEARGFMFGYEKLFGAEPASQNDLKSQREGRETSLDRTRRLLYVTCSRSKSSLALMVYSNNPEAVRRHVVESGWFDTSEVILGQA
jgi:DNA helicase-2/ATP-dependent DNA helicase PcrA